MRFFKSSSLKKDAFLCTIMTFVVAGLLYFAFVNLSVLDPFEKAFRDFKFTDMYYAERFKPEKRSDKIILVNIKHADRFQLSQALQRIAKSNPKAIGLDVIFKDQKMAFTDSILKASIQKMPNIVLSYYQDGDSLVENHPFFKFPNTSKGYINLNLLGQNTVVRDFQGYQSTSERYGFATALAVESGAISQAFLKKRLNEPLPINYIGDKEVFLSFDIDEILESDTIPALENAIVLLGYLGDSNPKFDIEDKHFTPLNKSWVGRAVPDTFGVTIHANILNMLVKDNLIYKVSNITIYLFAFLLCYVLVYQAMRLYQRNNFVFDVSQRLIQLVLSVLLLYLALLLLQSNVYINIIPVLLLCLLGLEMIDYYIYLMEYLNKKFGWQSTFL